MSWHTLCTKGGASLNRWVGKDAQEIVDVAGRLE